MNRAAIFNHRFQARQEAQYLHYMRPQEEGRSYHRDLNLFRKSNDGHQAPFFTEEEKIKPGLLLTLTPGQFKRKNEPLREMWIDKI